MRKCIKSYFAAILTVAVLASTFLFAGAVNGKLEYYMTDDGTGIGVARYVDSNTADEADDRGGSVEIPAKVNGYDVVEIGNQAFAEYLDSTKEENCLKSVIIPSTVTKIGNQAFYECRGLEKVEIPYGVTEIGKEAFFSCINLKTVIIPETVRTIGENILKNCDKAVVYCEPGSVIETYAKSNKIPCKSMYPTGASLNKTEASLGVGETLKLKASLKPSDVYYKDCFWISSNKSVATVDASGKVKAVGFGTAEITCYALLGEAKASCKITIGLGKVTGLKAADATYTGLTLKWNAVKDAAGYRVQQYKNGGWKTIKTVKTNSLKLSDLGTCFSAKYRVRAYVTNGSKTVYGGYSSAVTAKTKTPGTVKNVKFTKNTATSVTLSWSKVSGADGYAVYRYVSSTKKYTKVGTTSKTSFTVSKLSSGTKYVYKVKAYATAGKDTVYSTSYSSSVTSITKPAQVKNLKKTDVTRDSVSLSWNSVKGAKSYIIYTYLDGTYTKKATVTTTYATVKNLSKDKKYSFAVRAYNSLDETKYYGAYSAILTVKTNYLPSEVEDILAEFNSVFADTAASSRFMATKSITRTAKITDYEMYDKNAYDTANAWLTYYNATSTFQKNFFSGKDTTTGEKVSSFMSPTGAVKPIPVSAVKKASITTDGSGFSVTITLKSESVSGFKAPKYNSYVTDYINWDGVSTEIMEDIFLTDVSTKYSGTVIKAKVNKKGRLDTLTVSAPYTATVRGEIASADSMVKLSGKIYSDYIFIW